MKIRYILILLTILVMPLALSQDETDSGTTFGNSYGWLENATKTKDWELSSVRELSFAILALNNKDYDVSDGLGELISRGSLKNCWPKLDCNTIDTALAGITLRKTGKDVSSIVDWMEKTEETAAVQGNWILQIVSSQSGNCKVFCDDGSEKNVNVDDLTQVDGLCGPIGNQKSIIFDVDCADVGGVTDISLLYRVSHANYDETFLIQGVSSELATIELNNACLPKTEGGACDLESTLYASWFLKEIGEEDKIHTLPYLVQNLDDDPLNVALLYLITNNEPYGNWLSRHQDLSGSFTSSIYKTSLVAYSLIQNGDTGLYQNTTEWINMKKRGESWNDNILETSIALIALHGELNQNQVEVTEKETEICNNEIDDDGDDLIDCNDDDCLDSFECSTCSIADGDMCESDTDCLDDEECDPLSCTCELKPCDERANVECAYNSQCGFDEECDIQDCICVPMEGASDFEICYNDIDDDGDDLIDCDDDDCETDPDCESSLLWLWILILVLLVGGSLGFLYYTKYPKKGKTFNDFKNDAKLFFSKIFKKKEKKSFEKYVASRQPQQVQRPFQQTERQTYQKPKTSKTSKTTNKVEQELEKSLKEAKKLLKK